MTKIGTDTTPAIKGKYIGSCYFEAGYNELTQKVILQLTSCLDGRVKQEEFDPEEAEARWQAVTGTPLFH